MVSRLGLVDVSWREVNKFSDSEVYCIASTV